MKPHGQPIIIGNEWTFLLWMGQTWNWNRSINCGSDQTSWGLNEANKEKNTERNAAHRTASISRKLRGCAGELDTAAETISEFSYGCRLAYADQSRERPINPWDSSIMSIEGGQSIGSVPDCDPQEKSAFSSTSHVPEHAELYLIFMHADFYVVPRFSGILRGQREQARDLGLRYDVFRSFWVSCLLQAAWYSCYTRPMRPGRRKIRLLHVRYTREMAKKVQLCI